MSDFIDILLMRMPHALRVVLRIAFYFSLLAIFLPRLTPRTFHAIESLLSRLAERKTLAVVALFFIVIGARLARSEERRVGKEGRPRWSRSPQKKAEPHRNTTRHQ